jgi:predicted DCC family thiol-disulfide oxidoreductase YuxK
MTSGDGGQSIADVEILFFDGECGLCHGFVKFCLAREVAGARLQFAPLQGETADRLLRSEGASELPDSIVFWSNGRILVRTQAVCAVCFLLKAPYPFLARLLQGLPLILTDFCYDLVARVRKMIFRAPPSACPVVPEHLRGRFLG